MTKQVLAITVLCIGVTLLLTTPAHADIITPPPTSSYDSPGYDMVTTLPPNTPVVIGTFTFTIPAGQNVSGMTVSGTFGNGDSPTTALSDYYLGFAGDEAAVEVASCDDPLADCASNQNGPTSWSATLTPMQIADLAPALASGSIDFSYIWGSNSPIPDFINGGFLDQYVYAGPATLDITTTPIATPEPATVLLCFAGVTGIAAFRRFRQP